MKGLYQSFGVIILFPGCEDTWLHLRCPEHIHAALTDSNLWAGARCQHGLAPMGLKQLQAQGLSHILLVAENKLDPRSLHLLCLRQCLCSGPADWSTSRAENLCPNM